MDGDSNGFGNGNGSDRDDFRRWPERMRRTRAPELPVLSDPLVRSILNRRR
jgi:hypothetical protein